ncbi:hypothetical protein M569_16421 [Genlisea aurea]|uniref:Uncharacterized protein n=1 Tax=Genlisea aurea TaxID=192259 RepID=S8D6Y0_9LAMI|nr:hypothetical protein M569_16421 [Genlisea aurea]
MCGSCFLRRSGSLCCFFLAKMRWRGGGRAELRISKELTTLASACRLDVDAHAMDTTLEARANSAIRALAAGVEVHALSMESLRDVTECLLEMNQEVVKVILDCKKDVWRNQDLFSLVEDHFDNTLHTLDFCSALQKSLHRARDAQIRLLVALQELEGEEGKPWAKSQCCKALEELKRFKETGNPFGEDFFQCLHSVHQHQMLMLDKLQRKKRKLDGKLKSIQAWRRISSIIFATTFAALLICSVVAAALSLGPIAAGLSAAASIPIGSIGKWIDSLLRKREAAIRGQKEIVNSMKVGSYVAVKDLDGIRVMVDKLEMEMEWMMRDADDFGIEAAVRIGVQEMKRKLQGFMKDVDDLGAQADCCSRDIRRARTVVLQRIIKPPSSAPEN